TIFRCCALRCARTSPASVSGSRPASTLRRSPRRLPVARERCDRVRWCPDSDVRITLQQAPYERRNRKDTSAANSKFARRAPRGLANFGIGTLATLLIPVWLLDLTFLNGFAAKCWERQIRHTSNAST